MPRPRQPRQPANRFAALAVTAAAALLTLSGCSLLSDSDENVAGDQVGDRTTTTDLLTADTIEAEPGEEQDDDSTTTATADQTAPPDPPVETLNDFCPAAKRNNVDIAFNTGGTSASMDSTLPADEADLYRIEVRDDQIMTIAISSTKDNALAGLLDPSGELVMRRFVDQTVAPTRAGTYIICVSPGSGSTDYRLDVSVIDDNTPTKVSAEWCGSSVNDRGEIRFKPSTFGATVENGVIRGERDLYSIDAGEGQALDVILTSLEDNAVFDLRTPSGEMLITEVSDFRIPLPESGTYQFCIGSTRGNASYSLDLVIN